jgi:hypothetical protein
MRKLTIVVLVLLCQSFYSPQLKAQNTSTGGGTAGGDNAFGKGSLIVNPGVGFGYDYGYIGTFFPAIAVTVEDGLNANVGPGTLGIGGELGFKFGSYDYSFGDYSASYSETIIAARITYHWSPPSIPKLDLYGGIPIGFRIDHYSEWDDYVTGYDVYGYPVYGYKKVGATGVDPFFGLYLGAQYYFNNRIGVFGELGYNISALEIGVSFKLR